MRRFLTVRQVGYAMFIGLGLSYFGLQLMKGERGVYAYLRETHRHSQLEAEMAQIRAEREAMEVQVAGLRSDSLDLDLLDEQARRMLGLMAPEEKVILLQVR